MAVSSSKTGPFYNSTQSISFGSLRSNFKITNSGSIKASELRRNTSLSNTNPIVPDATENAHVSTSSNWRVSQLRTAIKYYNITQSGTNTNLDLGNNTYWNSNLGKNIVKRIIITGTCGSNSTGQYAASISSNIYNLTIDVYGGIYGAGGAGGTISSINGKNGGSALLINPSSSNNIGVYVRSSAKIYGGGGGGERGKNGNNGTSGYCNDVFTISNIAGCNGCQDCNQYWSYRITSISSSGTTATVTTSSNFPYKVGATITVSGVRQGSSYSSQPTNSWGQFGVRQPRWNQTVWILGPLIPEYNITSTIINKLNGNTFQYKLNSDPAIDNPPTVYYSGTFATQSYPYMNAGTKQLIFCGKAGGCACSWGICAQGYSGTCANTVSYSVPGGVGGAGGNGANGRGYNNFSGSLTGQSGTNGTAGNCSGYTQNGSPPPSSGGNGENGGNGGNWGQAGGNTSNSGSGGAAGRAISGSGYSVSGSINSTTIKGSYY